MFFLKSRFQDILYEAQQFLLSETSHPSQAYGWVVLHALLQLAVEAAERSFGKGWTPVKWGVQFRKHATPDTPFRGEVKQCTELEQGRVRCELALRFVGAPKPFFRGWVELERVEWSFAASHLQLHLPRNHGVFIPFPLSIPVLDLFAQVAWWALPDVIGGWIAMLAFNPRLDPGTDIRSASGLEFPTATSSSECEFWALPEEFEIQSVSIEYQLAGERQLYIRENGTPRMGVDFSVEFYAHAGGLRVIFGRANFAFAKVHWTEYVNRDFQ